MPNRILRDWTDSHVVNEVDAHAERLFLRLIMKADDFGRFHADPRLVKASCFPLKSEVRDTDITRWLAACQEAGMIRCYSDARGRRYLEIQNFRQRSRASESKYPSPPQESSPESPASAPAPASSCADGGMTVLCPSNDQQMTGTRPTVAHGDGDVFGDEDEVGGGRESVRAGAREVKVETSGLVVEEIVAAYPRQDSPVECRRSVRDDLLSGEDAQHVLRAVRECAVHIQAAPGGSGNRYVPTARTFFVERQWRSPEAFQHRWKPQPQPKTVGSDKDAVAREQAASSTKGRAEKDNAAVAPADTRVNKVKIYRIEDCEDE